MPTYCYRCPRCGLEQEHKHGVNEQFPVSCPYCSSKTESVGMIPKIYKPPVHFKGSGFYETDYKGK